MRIWSRLAATTAPRGHGSPPAPGVSTVGTFLIHSMPLTLCHLAGECRRGFAHGSVFSIMSSTTSIVDPHRTTQIGIRSPVEREIYEWTLSQGVTVIPADEVHERGPQGVGDRVRQVVGDAPVYLSFDIDALDPAFAPGTGTPEIRNPVASWQAQSTPCRLGGLRFAGMDVVEVAPAYDVSEITALAAATMVWEYLALLAASFHSFFNTFTAVPNDHSLIIGEDVSNSNQHIPDRVLGIHRHQLTAFESGFIGDADIEQQNLVSVSSIFPPGCELISRDAGVITLEPARATFCVMARADSDEALLIG